MAREKTRCGPCGNLCQFGERGNVGGTAMAHTHTDHLVVAHVCDCGYVVRSAHTVRMEWGMGQKMLHQGQKLNEKKRTLSGYRHVSLRSIVCIRLMPISDE